MEKEVVYVAELDSDVDDVVAAHYLFNEGVLKCVVCDPYPRTPEGLARKGKLETLGIDVVKKMPPVYAVLNDCPPGTTTYFFVEKMFRRKIK